MTDFDLERFLLYLIKDNEGITTKEASDSILVNRGKDRLKRTEDCLADLSQKGLIIPVTNESGSIGWHIAPESRNVMDRLSPAIESSEVSDKLMEERLRQMAGPDRASNHDKGPKEEKEQSVREMKSAFLYRPRVPQALIHIKNHPDCIKKDVQAIFGGNGASIDSRINDLVLNGLVVCSLDPQSGNLRYKLTKFGSQITAQIEMIEHMMMFVGVL